MNELKYKISACGISCYNCFAFKDGEIKDSATHLKLQLGNFDIYAKRFSSLLNEPVFDKYPEFNALLQYFAEIECKGCRKETCKLFKDCKVRECSKEKQVDFCFQCDEFPCQNTGFDEHLNKRSVSINYRIKEIGLINYFNEIKDKSRY